MSKKWICYYGEPDPANIQVVPENDSREHVTDGGECWCNPTIEQHEHATITSHTAADGRATQERQFLHGAN